MKKRSKPETFSMRVIRGGFAPADAYTASRLRERGYHIDDIVGCTFRKLNSPAFNRLVHRIGQLCVANIDEFHGMEAHAVLKRLQWEGNIWCDEMAVMISGAGMAIVRTPRSLDFDTADDGERHVIGRAFCRWIAEKYWKTLTPEQINEMAESFIDEV
jgi:hypothetical protein